MRRRRLVQGENLNKAISASTWNELLSLLDHRDTNGLWSSSSQLGMASNRRPPNPNALWLRNDSGANLSQFNILGIASPAVDAGVNNGEFQREVTIAGVLPTKEHYGAFAVLCDAIPDGQCGWAVAGGVVQCRVDVLDDKHKFCEVQEGNLNSLKSCVRGSCQIIWKRGGGPGTWCYVRLGNYVPPLLWFAKVKENMCPEKTTQDCYELEAADGCVEEDVPDEVNAKNEVSLAACANEKVVLVRDSGSEDDGWWILQAVHGRYNVITGAAYVGGATCKLSFTKTQVVAMSCCADAAPDTIPLYEHTVVGSAGLATVFEESMDPANSTCQIEFRVRWDTFCSFEPQELSAVDVFSIIAMTQARVSTGATWNATSACIEETLQYVWVPCAADPDTPIDVLCFEECN